MPLQLPVFHHIPSTVCCFSFEYCSYVPLPSPLQLLGYIHQQKNQKGVSEMILRLYNPFLWRALKVANPHVRANAASLLFDAFPLQEPSSTREEIDLGMQKQFDAMMVWYTHLLYQWTSIVCALHVLYSYAYTQALNG